MNRITSTALGAFALLAACPALAQPRPAFCPEGRTAAGTCVNVRLATAARQQAVCYSQIKLSYIVCPGVMPSKDVDLKFPFNVVLDRFRELNSLFER